MALQHVYRVIHTCMYTDRPVTYVATPKHRPRTKADYIEQIFAIHGGYNFEHIQCVICRSPSFLFCNRLTDVWRTCGRMHNNSVGDFKTDAEHVLHTPNIIHRRQPGAAAAGPQAVQVQAAAAADAGRDLWLPTNPCINN